MVAAKMLLAYVFQRSAFLFKVFHLILMILHKLFKVKFCFNCFVAFVKVSLLQLFEDILFLSDVFLYLFLFCSILFSEITHFLDHLSSELRFLEHDVPL